MFCLGISSLGLGVRMLTVGYAPNGTSGRNSSMQLAAVLNTTGMYSITRNPLYLGNCLMWLGPSLFMREWWLAGLCLLAFALYHERIILAEEAFLREQFKEVYLEWAARTPVFFPNFSAWRRPELPFSIRTAVKREYLGFFALISVFTLFEAATEFAVEGRFWPDLLWTVIFGTSLILFIGVRTVAKSTTWLAIPGR